MRHATVLGVVLAFLSAGAMPGCEYFDSGPVDPQPVSPAEMRAYAATTKSEGIIETPTAATTPRKAYQMYRGSIRGRKFAQCWDLLSSATKDSHERATDQLKVRVLNYPTPLAADLDVLRFSGLTRKEAQKLTSKMYFVARCKMRDADPQGFSGIRKSEYHHGLVGGDNAKVFVRIDGRLQAEPLRMVREGGVWRVDRPAYGAVP